MIKTGDIVRIVDGSEVLEGQVTSVFESNGVEYVTVGTRVYTTQEVTKVPTRSAGIDADQFTYPEAVEVKTVDEVALVRDMVESVLVKKAENGIDKYGNTLSGAGLSKAELLGKAIHSAVGTLIYLAALKEAK